MKIKICGITNLNDAIAISESGADYIGMIFVKNSTRYITSESANMIASQKMSALRVGVFCNENISEISRKIEAYNLSVVQLHGNENYEYIEILKELNVEVWKTVWLNSIKDVDDAINLNADKLLVDSKVGNLSGGTGKLANWNLAELLSNKRRIILAGGISVDNAFSAIAKINPFALDLNSSVEFSVGKKDIIKITKFLKKIKSKI